MTAQLKKLMNVKSIVTILLTFAFTYLAIVGKVTADEFLTIYSVIVAFYFGTQYEKKNKEDNNA